MDPLQRPIFIVGTPQAGTTYVFSALGRLPGVVALSRGARSAFDHAVEVRPALRGHDSNRRTADDVTPETAERIRTDLIESISRREHGANATRMVDGAPRHALRIPFLDAVFPDAMFVYVYRAPRESIAGMIEAWRSGLYVTYPNLPDWPGPRWSMLLVPGWRALAGKSVAEIATVQWTTTTRFLLDDLQALAPHRWAVVDYGALLEDPGSELERLAGVLSLSWRPEAASDSPVTHVLRPGQARLAELEDDLQRLLPQTIGLAEVAHDLLAAPVSRRPTATPDFEAATRSVHSAGFARLLDRLDSSLLLTTGTTGKLVCVRHDGARVNTHFEDVARAGAVAASGSEFAVVSGKEVLRFGAELGAEGVGGFHDAPDARFVLRGRSQGRARVLAFAGGNLWMATGDTIEQVDGDRRWSLPAAIGVGASSWRITGIAVESGEPAYVCAQPTDRGHDQARGHIVDCRTGEVVADELVTPRRLVLHDDRLWVVERDPARLSAFDPASGVRTAAVDLPAPGRGLAITGSVAFVSLSRIPQGADDDAGEPFSGVSVVDLVHAELGAYLRFEADVPDVWDLAVLPYRYPEIRTD